jgi:histidinol dehydrogenase
MSATDFAAVPAQVPTRGRTGSARLLGVTSLAHFLNDGVVFFIPVIGALLAQGHHVSTVLITAMLTIFYITSAGFGIVVGLVADALGRRGSMIALGIATLGVSLLGFYAALSLTGVPSDVLVLVAAAVAGVGRAFAVGGAQAVGALAYGTASIPKVDKITGPGNAYVAAAKRRVFGLCGIDMIAGPSEILVIADGSTPADWVAMDLFSQAEHDELAQSILLCPDSGYIEQVWQAMRRLLPQMPRRDIIEASLRGRGALIRVRDLEQACELADRIAPEHLELSTREPRVLAERLRHAGAIFLGAYTSESLGDYCAGPNHVLPTSGTARFSSALGVYDFVKRTSLIEVSRRGAARLGHIASVLGRGERLQAHATAAEMRLHDIGSDE